MDFLYIVHFFCQDIQFKECNIWDIIRGERCKWHCSSYRKSSQYCWCCRMRFFVELEKFLFSDFDTAVKVALKCKLRRISFMKVKWVISLR